MPHSPKIATCSYCGTRAALVLGGKVTRHELTCASCGAPLHALKRLKSDDGAKALRPAEPGAKAPAALAAAAAYREPPRKPKKGKRRKSKARWFFEEVADIVEDIFD